MSDAFYSRDLVSPREYYARFSADQGSLEAKFKDIDDKTHFGTSMHSLEDPHTRNFVLDFGNEDAFCATNLSPSEFKNLLGKPVRQLYLFLLVVTFSNISQAGKMLRDTMDVGGRARC